MKIKKILAMQILDSRGWPTIECNLLLDNNYLVKSSVPSGASTGKLEALELRDCDKNIYMGKSVFKAIGNINNIIAPKFINKLPDFKIMDQELINLDNTENKANLGANAILAVSMAVTRAQAYMENLELYKFIGKIFGNNNFLLPNVMFNVLNGGAHADNGIPFQEFMIMPVGNYSFSEKLQRAVIVYQNLKNILKKEGYSVGVGDEGGFAPKILGSGKDIITKTLDLLVFAVKNSGYSVGKDIVFCLDVAASQFYNEKEKIYEIGSDNLNTTELVTFYDNLISSYPIYSIEDGICEDDWSGWKFLTEKLGGNIQLVGDDIFVTNPKLIKIGIDKKVANSVLIKPNQIGTVTETLNAIKLAKDNNYKTVISHRSGETMDTFISDLAVGTNSAFMKAGAPCRGERVAKYNRLLEIEANL
ncbi:phosphopyruvate hydratase [Candidatus Dependentiae bacterium]|nr:phosphopyruvate hydratase [Candidatus Dependentiae bacterium]MBU4386870.1 phosphopyruvate hydratase [Candidatus Dependentiae bacterium]MCG2756479.1 phosphopyruvate hydratase [Candidatus Dependentiae bacterium]